MNMNIIFMNTHLETVRWGRGGGNSLPSEFYFPSVYERWPMIGSRLPTHRYEELIGNFVDGPFLFYNRNFDQSELIGPCWRWFVWRFFHTFIIHWGIIRYWNWMYNIRQVRRTNVKNNHLILFSKHNLRMLFCFIIYSHWTTRGEERLILNTGYTEHNVQQHKKNFLCFHLWSNK